MVVVVVMAGNFVNDLMVNGESLMLMTVVVANTRLQITDMFKGHSFTDKLSYPMA